MARSTGKAAIFLARRINRPDGTFSGIVYTAIGLEKIKRLFQTLYLGPKGVVTLLDIDGEVIVRYPEAIGSVIGEKGTPEAYFNAPRDAPETGMLFAKSPIDGIERAMSYRKLSAYSSYLFVGIADDDYFADWHKNFATITFLMALFLSVTGVAAGLLYAGWKRQEALSLILRQQARTDPLTGCANRRHFLEVLETERQRGLRYAKRFCVATFDLDHFKTINDHYGHPAGDQALSFFAQVVGRSLRPSDTFGRMGGEEFSIILPETSIDSAFKMAERIRVEVESSPIVLNSVTVMLTVSIGIAEWNMDHTDTIENLLARADAALYKAKKGGRNSVCTEQG